MFHDIVPKKYILCLKLLQTLAGWQMMSYIKSMRLSCLPLICILCASSYATESPVGRQLSTPVEKACSLDIATPGIYSGLLMAGAGSKMLPSTKNCQVLSTTTIGKEYPSHRDTKITWEYYLTHVNVYANGKKMGDTSVPHWSFKPPRVQVSPLGRMTIVDVGTQTYVFDNQEQQWCKHPMLKEGINKRAEVSYWYHRPSRNIVRLAQNEETSDVVKTQHYLPDVCAK